MDIHSDYLAEYLDPVRLRACAGHAVSIIRRTIGADAFDAIAFTGNSGAMAAPMIASILRKGLILVRKPNEKSHSSYMVEGMYKARTYIIVDDFISTGKTIGGVIERIEASEDFYKPTPVGVLEFTRCTPDALRTDDMSKMAEVSPYRFRLASCFDDPDRGQYAKYGDLQILNSTRWLKQRQLRAVA